MNKREKFLFRREWMVFARSLKDKEYMVFITCVVEYGLERQIICNEMNPESEHYFFTKVLPVLEADWTRWEKKTKKGGSK